MNDDARRNLAAAALFVAALVAWLFSGYAGRDRLGEIAVFAILAMALDLVVGYAGMVSLGHALFFGLGAYGMAIATVMLKWPPLAGLGAGIAIAAFAALVVGVLVVRLHGVFFIMVTLAFAQMGWAYFHKERLFGGVGGMSGVRQLDLGWAGLMLMNPADFALFAIGVATLVYLALSTLVRSPFGRMLVAIRENENRARALGCPVQRYKLAAFVLSGAVAGLAGTLAAQRTGFVSPELLVWTTSGEALIMVIVGGLGSLVGPVAGAACWVLLHHGLSAQTPYWGVPMGLFFIAVVLFAGRGLWGLVRARS